MIFKHCKITFLNLRLTFNNKAIFTHTLLSYLNPNKRVSGLRPSWRVKGIFPKDDQYLYGYGALKNEVLNFKFRYDFQ
jgi:hypothetical protein